MLPAFCRMGLISWGIEEMIRQALPDPGTGPLGWRHVPSEALALVLSWAYRFSCHHEVGWTIPLLKRHFWWGMTEKDVQD